MTKEEVEARVLRVLSRSPSEPVPRDKLEYFVLEDYVHDRIGTEPPHTLEVRDAISRLLRANVVAEGFARSIVAVNSI